MINKVEICGVNTTKLPILSNEEKKELLLKIKNGDKDAREKFINGNLRLVLSVVQRFSGRAESADDLFQIGCINTTYFHLSYQKENLLWNYLLKLFPKEVFLYFYM